MPRRLCEAAVLLEIPVRLVTQAVEPETLEEQMLEARQGLALRGGDVDQQNLDPRGARLVVVGAQLALAVDDRRAERDLDRVENGAEALRASAEG